MPETPKPSKPHFRPNHPNAKSPYKLPNSAPPRPGSSQMRTSNSPKVMKGPRRSPFSFSSQGKHGGGRRAGGALRRLQALGLPASVAGARGRCGTKGPAGPARPPAARHPPNRKFHLCAQRPGHQRAQEWGSAETERRAAGLGARGARVSASAPRGPGPRPPPSASCT